MKDRCLRTSSLIFRVHLNYCQNSKTLMHIIEQLASQRETLNFSIENFNRTTLAKRQLACSSIKLLKLRNHFNISIMNCVSSHESSYPTQ
jgi:hypothetical protein